MTTDTMQATWNTYQDAWADITPEERTTLLAQSVAENCTYNAPGSEGNGLPELTAYVVAFQQQYPGAYFKTHRFITHHGQSLAEWILYGKDGAELLPGSSYARFAPDGRLVQLVGFWVLPS